MPMTWVYEFELITFLHFTLPGTQYAHVHKQEQERKNINIK